MEDEVFSGIANGAQIDANVLEIFKKKFVQVQSILDQNRLLINEIDQNQRSKIPANLLRNVGLIRELNNNIIRAVGLYGELSNAYIKSMEVSSEGDSATKSDGGGRHKRIRSVM